MPAIETLCTRALLLEGGRIRHQYQCWYRAKMREFCLRCMFLETLYFLALWILTYFGRPFE